MRNKFVLLSLFLAFGLSAMAQRTMSDINRIKRDKSYLYGEATLDSKDAALKLAYELLEVEIKNWATQKSADISTVLASGINDFADTIILPRGNMVRAFAFVKTSNLKTLKGKNLAVKVDQPLPEKTDTMSAPVAEESVPVAEEPVPVAGKTVPVAEESVPVAEDSVPVAEVPTPVVEERTPETDTPSPVVDSPVTKARTIEDDVLEQLLPITTFYDLEETMKPLKAAGKILEYGKYATMTDPGACYLIVYDRQAKIKAILDKGTTVRKNLKTGADDSEKNYHGCGAIWFKVKQ